MRQLSTKFPLFLLLIIFSNTGFAQICPTASNIICYNNQSIGGDLTINAGEWYHFTGNINMYNNKIHIKDGGRLTAENCTIAATGGSWHGIQIDQTDHAHPTNFTAVDFKNVTLKDAYVAFELSGRDVSSPYYSAPGGSVPNMISRSINVESSIISGCTDFVQMHGSTQPGALLKNLDSPLTIRFKDTDFWNTQSQWPIWLKFGTNIEFIDCYFNFDAQIMLHFRSMNNLLIKGCKFYNRHIGTRSFIEMHESHINGAINFRIEDNLFGFTGFPGQQIGVGHGSIFGFTKHATITGNEFRGLPWKTDQLGIRFEAGSTPGMYVANNRFYGMNDAIKASKWSNADILNNTFEQCGTGINFSSGSNSAMIRCNDFIKTKVGISANSLNLLNQGSRAFQNTFDQVTNHIIYTGSNNIEYWYDPSLPKTIDNNFVFGSVVLAVASGPNGCNDARTLISGSVYLGTQSACSGPTVLEGMLIQATATGGGSPYFATSDANGYFELYIPHGSYDVTHSEVQPPKNYDYEKTTCTSIPVSHVVNNSTSSVHLTFVFYDTDELPSGGGGSSGRAAGSGNVAQSNQTTVNVYPNPSSTGKYNLNIKGFEAQTTIKLLNIYGVLVDELSISDSQTSVDLSGYAKGIYLIQITDGINEAVQKVIFE